MTLVNTETGEVLAPKTGLMQYATANSLDLPDGLNFEEWAEAGAVLERIDSGVMWWLGDWWRYGERAYGEAASAAAPTGYTAERCRKAAWVADQFDETVRRRTNLGFEHHYVVAALDPVDADHLLDEAAAQNLTRQEFRSVVRLWKERNYEPANEDEATLRRLDIKVQPYDVWQFTDCHDAMGSEHPGRIPGQLVCHALYFFTQPGDLVIDPMAGSGTTLDACKIMGRRCLGYDIDHRHNRSDVEFHDLAEGWPASVADADLIFWDPPYYDKMDHSTIGSDGYIEGSISGLTPDEYLDWLTKRFEELHSAVRSGTRLAFLMSDWDPENAKRHDDHRGIFLWDYSDRLRDAGWSLRRQIQVPLSTQQVHPDIVIKFRRARRLARLERYLLVAEA